MVSIFPHSKYKMGAAGVSKAHPCTKIKSSFANFKNQFAINLQNIVGS